MGLKMGEIDFTSSMLTSEYRLTYLEIALGKLMSLNPQLKQLTEKDKEACNAEALQIVKNKYPNSGIEVTKT